MTIEAIIDGILASEGGYVDHPNDRGGPTNLGITLPTLRDWRKAPVDAADLKAMTEAEARLIYRKRYVEAPGFDALPDPLRWVVVDWGVLSGPPRAARGLQRAVGVKDDGVIGAVTLAAVAALTPKEAAVRLCAEQARQIGRLITDDRSQAAFAAGWMNRLADKLVATQT